MGVFKSQTILWIVWWTLALGEQGAHSQQTPASGATGVPQQSGPSGTANPAPGQPRALDNSLLEQADGGEIVTYLDSHFDFEYRRDQLEGGASSNEYDITARKAIDEKQHFAVAIELPLVNLNGSAPELRRPDSET